MKFSDIVRFWYRAAVLILLVLILRTLTANAESAIVSFDDAEHLVALQDSVVGVVDSTYARSDSCLEGYTKSYYHGRSQNDGYVYYFRWIVTYRELGCVTARWPEVVADMVSRSYDGFFDDIFPTKTIPGEAIINYRRVTQ